MKQFAVMDRKQAIYLIQERWISGVSFHFVVVVDCHHVVVQIELMPTLTHRNVQFVLRLALQVQKTILGAVQLNHWLLAAFAHGHRAGVSHPVVLLLLAHCTVHSTGLSAPELDHSQFFDQLLLDHLNSFTFLLKLVAFCTVLAHQLCIGHSQLSAFIVDGLLGQTVLLDREICLFLLPHRLNLQRSQLHGHLLLLLSQGSLLLHRLFFEFHLQLHHLLL
jgi:hypothetical protein